MSQDALLYIMAGAVTVSAISLVAQAIVVIFMARTISRLKQQVTDFLPRAHTFLDATQKTVDESRKQIHEVATRATNILETAQNQLNKVDAALNEVGSRAKVQMERVEMVLDDTVSRVHETVVELNGGVLRPLRELRGVSAGVRAAVQHLMNGGRPTVAQATADEEMFI